MPTAGTVAAGQEDAGGVRVLRVVRRFVLDGPPQSLRDRDAVLGIPDRGFEQFRERFCAEAFQRQCPRAHRAGHRRGEQPELRDAADRLVVRQCRGGGRGPAAIDRDDSLFAGRLICMKVSPPR